MHYLNTTTNGELELRYGQQESYNSTGLSRARETLLRKENLYLPEQKITTRPDNPDFSENRAFSERLVVL
jgi:hypothetical protein